eukprot:TRINITY_DN23528_c0_g1_i1.p1 TRINITY_DN23528_c0_g1~~TRINITY_DN23528_c0_g1_i1.p1  ORF type:complete len:212 (+),score=12.96 TRINITY_DN23528_c0_g1_i1:105-740(+)
MSQNSQGSMLWPPSRGDLVLVYQSESKADGKVNQWQRGRIVKRESSTHVRVMYDEILQSENSKVMLEEVVSEHTLRPWSDDNLIYEFSQFKYGEAVLYHDETYTGWWIGHVIYAPSQQSESVWIVFMEYNQVYEVTSQKYVKEKCLCQPFSVVSTSKGVQLRKLPNRSKHCEKFWGLLPKQLQEKLQEQFYGAKVGKRKVQKINYKKFVES